MEQKQTEKRKPTREENLEMTKRELAFQQQLAREGKLSEYLREQEEQIVAEHGPLWYLELTAQFKNQAKQQEKL